MADGDIPADFTVPLPGNARDVLCSYIRERRYVTVPSQVLDAVSEIEIMDPGFKKSSRPEFHYGPRGLFRLAGESVEIRPYKIRWNEVDPYPKDPLPEAIKNRLLSLAKEYEQAIAEDFLRFLGGIKDRQPIREDMIPEDAARFCLALPEHP
jgi:hypothetical protein